MVSWVYAVVLQQDQEILTGWHHSCSQERDGVLRHLPVWRCFRGWPWGQRLKGALGPRSKATQLNGCCINEPREPALAQTYKMFITGAKLCSWDQQYKGKQDADLWTAVTRSNHPAFVQGNKALTMTLLSFCFTWQQGFEHTIEMLPVISIYPLADLCH